MIVGREVEMFELVPKVRQRQCVVLETDRKSVPSRRSSMTEVHPVYVGVDSLTRETLSWPRPVSVNAGDRSVSRSDAVLIQLNCTTPGRTVCIGSGQQR